MSSAEQDQLGQYGESQGDRRLKACPHCQYDLSLIPGHVCPECGGDRMVKGHLHSSSGGAAHFFGLMGLTVSLIASAAALVMTLMNRGFSLWAAVLSGFIAITAVAIRGWIKIRSEFDFVSDESAMGEWAMALLCWAIPAFMVVRLVWLAFGSLN